MSRGRGWAIGGGLSSVAVVLLAACGRSPIAGCGEKCAYPCQPRSDVADYCRILGYAPSKASPCLIDGSPVVQCAAGSCGTWVLSSGGTLTVPVGSMWPTLGPRDDLHLYVACPLPADAGAEASVAFGTPPANPADTFTLFFDGAPAQGCVCTYTGVACENVPRSVQTIGIRAAQAGTAIGDLNFADDECETTHVPCPG